MTEQATPPASRFQARAIATLWRTLSRWPVRWLWRIAALVGPQVYRFSKRERKVTEINLKVVYPDAPANQRQSLAKQSLQHSTATMLELGHAWMAPPEKVEASILAVHGRDKLDSARAEGRGVIVLAPHFGNWEVLNFWLSSHFPFTAMYEPPKITELEPIIRSRLLIDSTRQVVVQQSRPIEDTLYTIIHKMEDPKIQRKFILPVALVVFVWGLLAVMGKGEIADGAILLTLGGYMLIKVAGWEDEIRKFYHDLLSGTSERVSLTAYIIAALLLIIGVARGLDAMQEVSSLGMLAMVLGFMSLDGLLPLLLAGLLIIEIGRTADSYLQDGVFNFAIVTFFFTVTSLGLIVAGFVEIVNDIFVRGDFISTKVQYVLGGIIWAFIGFLVNDSIRDRQEQSLPGEE